MSRWYQAVHGKAEGPFSEEEIREGLKSGRFKALDLVFREGDVSWRLLSEVPEFQAGTEVPPASVASEECDWVVLMRRGSGFVQSGPFTREQVMERLSSGDIEYGHHAWRAGYKRWMRIGSIPEFDRRSRDRDGDSVNQVIPLPSQEELLQGVVRLNRTGSVPQAMESLPEGADGVDLLEVRPILMPHTAQELSRDEFTRSDSVSLPRPLPGDPTSGVVPEVEAEAVLNLKGPGEMAPRKDPVRRSVRLLFAGATAFLAIVIGLYAFNGSIDRAAKLDGPKRTVAEASSASGPEAKKPTEPEETLPPEAIGEDPNLSIEPSGSGLEGAPGIPLEKRSSGQETSAGQGSAAARAKMVIEIVPLKPESSPQIVFQTNAPVGEKILVSLKGLPGQILRATGYRREVTLTRGPGELPSIDLASWELAHGAYVIEASVGEARASREVFIGRKDEGFEAELKKQSENLQVLKLQERKALVSSARRFEELSGELGKYAGRFAKTPEKWAIFYPAWRKQAEGAKASLEKVFRADAQAVSIYEAQYSELDTARAGLMELATQIDNGIQQKRSIASTGLDALLAEIKRLRETAEKLD